MDALFYQHTRENFTENHLWLSLFVRPNRSVFTRVQRLACGITLLLLTMISNAMFFQTSDEETASATWVRLGLLRLSFTNFYISLIGIAITTPPIFFATYVFRNTEPKTERSEMQQKENSSSDSCCCRRNKDLEIGLYSSEDENFLTQKKRKFSYRVGYIAWAVLVLGSMASSFFLILYSMEWGNDKSEEWLSMFVLSFFESLILFDPLKASFFYLYYLIKSL